MLKLLLACGCLLLWMSGPVAAESGAPADVAVCAACHGDEAPSPFPSVPTIHGLPQAVLDNALFDFRATIRPCRKPDCGAAADCPDIDFCSIAAALSDEQISALASWYASRRFVAAGEPFDAALAARGAQLHQDKCDSCHTEGGTSSTEQATILRGQRKAYLRLALEDFRQERRVAVAEMDAMIRALSDDELTALVEFYASPRRPKQ
ncbi:MAG TPA: c-type cytochrome [Gammaproteobacteria bacterium]|nr:c-type cytochrome [Gammaproteobacteria bacterium]